MHKDSNNLTVSQVISKVTKRFEEAGLYFGHGTDNAQDEAYSLVYYALKIPHDADEKILSRVLNNSELASVKQLTNLRIEKRIPLPYLTNEAYFAGMAFYVDERALIPRSPFAELIERQFRPWITYNEVSNLLDLCTGSGCMAIAAAKMFPEAKVDAVDLSEKALAIAKINLERYGMKKQVNLIQSDLFCKLKGKKYDVIMSNPPYVSEEEMKSLPKEYKHEPSFALASEDNGLQIVIKILQLANSYLTEKGILLVEVGNSKTALEKRFPEAPFLWLDFTFGGDGVFLLTAEQLKRGLS